MIRELFTGTTAALQKNLDLRFGRHNILMSNVANAETPGYIAKDLHFENALRDAVKVENHPPLWRTDPNHFPHLAGAIGDVQGRVVAPPSDDVGRDLNTVSMDEEMAKLTANTLHYNASTEILSRIFEQLKTTINEGR